MAVVSLDTAGHPQYIKLAPLPGFTLKAIAEWAKNDLMPGCVVVSNGVACFSGVIDSGCLHQHIVVGGLKPKDLLEFSWINTVLGNLKTSFGGAYHAFDFAKYGIRYLAAFAYSFNRRFHLETLPMCIFIAAVTIGPRPANWLRQAEESF